jgi:hypothetical protein
MPRKHQRVYTPTRSRAAFVLRILGSVIAVGSMVAILAGVGSSVANAKGTVPPENGGTVKIDGTPFDDQPNNQPHTGCAFQIDFYGYGQGDLSATVTFEAAPPTVPAGDRVLLTDTVFIGEDDSSGGGSEAGLDASETYGLDFAGMEPHPQLGFHVKVTVKAEGSQGADVKYKLYWVTGCETTPPTTTTTSTSPPSPRPTATPSTTPTATTTTTAPTAPTISSTPTGPTRSTTSSSAPPASTVKTYQLEPVNAGVTSDSGNAGTLGFRAGLFVVAMLGLLLLVVGRRLRKMPRLKHVGPRQE